MFITLYRSKKPEMRVLVLIFLLGPAVSVRLRPQASLQRSSAPCVVKSLSALVLASSLACWPGPTTASAFDNAVPNSYTMPKSHGPQPSNLGIDKKSGKLRVCAKPSPNCFSTTSDFADEDDVDDENLWGVGDQTIPLWRFKGSPDEAFSLLRAAVDGYEVGQGAIDGGGFSVVTADPKTKYLYVQFESLKRGYIDDVEFAVNPDSSIQVMSSSRMGYLDYRVNAKRLNYLRSKLISKGFDIEEITAARHPVYFGSNEDIQVVRGEGAANPKYGSKKY